MIDVAELQDYLIKNPEHLVTILEKLHHEHIKDKGHYYSFANIGGDNINACSILKETLQYQNFSHGGGGSIFTLVQDDKHCNFPQSLEYVAAWTGFKGMNNTYKPKRLPFHGFYKHVSADEDNEMQGDLKTYDMSILPEPGSYSKLWLNEGVDLLTQEKFGITIDHESNRIIIPEFTCDHKLVGAKARLNTDECADNERWSMFKPFSKSKIIYGWAENYTDIQKKGTVVITESEKAVLQARSFGFNLCVSVGGHNISKTQEKYIKRLMAKRVIVAFDAGLTEEEIKYETTKLVSKHRFLSSEVYYIFDKDEELLKGKDSPLDNGREVFTQLLQPPYLKRIG